MQFSRLILILISLSYCSKNIKSRNIIPREVDLIRQQAQQEAGASNQSYFDLEPDRAVFYRNKLLPPRTMTVSLKDCPFITRNKHLSGDGIMWIEVNCAVDHGWGNVMVYGALCSPGYYYPDSERYDMPQPPINTYYDKQMRFYLTSEKVCRKYKIGRKYIGTIYRDSGDEGFVTLIDVEEVR